MSTSGRLVLCNMSVEAGATSGIVPGDEETVRYLREEAGVTDRIDPVLPDPDAVYERVIQIDAAKLAPQIACPHTVDNVKPIDAVPAPRSTRSSSAPAPTAAWTTSPPPRAS